MVFLHDGQLRDNQIFKLKLELCEPRLQFSKKEAYRLIFASSLFHLLYL